MKLRTVHRCLASPHLSSSRSPGWNAGERDLAQDPHELSALSCHRLRPSMTILLRSQLPAPLLLCPSPLPRLFPPRGTYRLSSSHSLCTSVIGFIAFLLPLQCKPHTSMYCLPIKNLPYPQGLSAWDTIFTVQINDQPSTDLPRRVWWGQEMGTWREKVQEPERAPSTTGVGSVHPALQKVIKTDQAAGTRGCRALWSRPCCHTE